MKTIALSVLAGLALALPAGYAQDTATNPPPDTTAAPAPAPEEGAAAAAAAPAVRPPEAAPIPADQLARDAEAAPAPAGPAIPLIVIDDLPLTDAIRNLARQAEINYQVDPRVAYGVPGPDGKITPMPSVSIRWENVTAQQALGALLANYSLQLVDDPKTKIATVKAKDPAAPDPLVTRIIQLKYASPSNVVTAVQTVFADPKRSKAVPDMRTSQLVLVATEKELLAAEDLITRLDLAPKQVLIEAQLMEVSRSPSTVKGIDWSGTLEAQNIAFGNGLSSGTTIATTPGAPVTTTLPGGRTMTTTPGHSETTTLTTQSGMGGFTLNTLSGLTPNLAIMNADGVRATMSFLNKDADTQVISTPRAVTLDNETARLAVTRAVPIFKVQASTQNTTGGSQVEYTNLGTILEVTPRITANSNIFLKVVPEVSSIFRTVRKVVVGTENEADEYDIRKIETQVMIPSAHTLVMGGLMSDSTKNIYSKVPVLGDIPLLGLAFRHENKAMDKKNLLIFITPTILQESNFRLAKGQAEKYLDSRPTEISGGINPDRAWESAKPRDWSAGRAESFEETPAAGSQ